MRWKRKRKWKKRRRGGGGWEIELLGEVLKAGRSGAEWESMWRRKRR
jgi:hypothetical protein